MNPYGGDLAVSRAFGDCDYKVYRSTEWLIRTDSLGNFALGSVEQGRVRLGIVGAVHHLNGADEHGRVRAAGLRWLVGSFGQKRGRGHHLQEPKGIS